MNARYALRTCVMAIVCALCISERDDVIAANAAIDNAVRAYYTWLRRTTSDDPPPQRPLASDARRRYVVMFLPKWASYRDEMTGPAARRAPASRGVAPPDKRHAFWSAMGGPLPGEMSRFTGAGSNYEAAEGAGSPPLSRKAMRYGRRR